MAGTPYSIAAPLARFVLLRAVGPGADLETLAAHVGVAPTTLSDPDARVPADAMLRIWSEVARRTGDPNLGLNLGRLLGDSGATLAGHIVRASRTVGEGLERVLRFYRVWTDAHPPVYERGAELARFAFRSKGTEVELPRHAIEFAFVWMTTLARKATGQALAPLRVRLEHPAPADRSALDATLACPIEYDQPENEIVMRSADWSIPTLGPDDDLAQVLEHTAKKLLGELPSRSDSEADVVREVRGALAPLVPGGDASIDAVATALAVHPRTLQRRLAEAGTTFAAVLDGVRRSLAEAHLARADHSLAEVALLVGFSDQSAFHRAFTRWTGDTPGAFRRRHRIVS